MPCCFQLNATRWSNNKPARPRPMVHTKRRGQLIEQTTYRGSKTTKSSFYCRKVSYIDVKKCKITTRLTHRLYHAEVPMPSPTLATLHPTVAEVTQRICERSRHRRGLYESHM